MAVNTEKIKKNFKWDATEYFRDVIRRNRLARSNDYRFAEVSGLTGLEEYIDQAQTAPAAVCVSEISPGYTILNNTPHTQRVVTVFLMKRHKIDDMQARRACLDELRELFRQVMSILFKERTMLEQGILYMDERVQFTEIDRYFAMGAACAFFQVSYTVQTNLVFRPEEWLT